MQSRAAHCKCLLCRYLEKQVGYMACSILMNEVRMVPSPSPAADML